MSSGLRTLNSIQENPNEVVDGWDDSSSVYSDDGQEEWVHDWNARPSIFDCKLLKEQHRATETHIRRSRRRPSTSARYWGEGRQRAAGNMVTTKGLKPYDEEDADIELLYAQAKKHAELGKKLEAARNRINAIGSNIESAIGPVNGGDMYRETQALQNTNNNVTRVLEQLSQVQRPLEGKADEERIIQEGPERTGLPNYLASIRRTAGKCEELSNSGARVNQEAAEQLSQLVNLGIKQVQDLYASLLQSMSTPVEPLKYITRKQPFPVFDGRKAELIEIIQFLTGPSVRGRGSNNSVGSIYVEIRGRYLRDSITNLATATLSTAMQPNTGNDIAMYRQGDCTIGSYAQGLSLALLAEWANISSVLPEDRHRIMEATAGEVLNDLTTTIVDLNNRIQSHLTTHCFLAYDVLGVVNDLAFEMDKQMGVLKQDIFGAVKPIRDTAKQSLSDLLEDIRRRIASMVFLPTDGAAIPFTTEVLTRLQGMTAYPVPLGSILSSVGDGNWSSQSTNSSSSSLPTLKSLDGSTDSSALLAHYITDSLETLITNLDNRSKVVHKNPRLTGVFMLNNMSIIDRMIRGSDLAPLLAGQSLSKLQDEKRKKFLGAYTEAWREAGLLLLDVQYTNRGARPPSGSAAAGSNSAAIVKSLSSKDKDATKEKFKNFNILFESLSAKHRELMPAMEKDVRGELVSGIRAIIEPLYARFWDRYHELDKGKGKYVRYDKGAMSSQLASLA